MQPLLSSWNEVAARLSEARTIALFLDFDGTLAGLRPHPSEVFLAPDVRRDLAKLTRSPKFRVWVISGRRQADISARVHVPGIRYLGLHGWEGRSSSVLRKPTKVALANVKRAIANAFPSQKGTSAENADTARLNGVWMEDKGATVAVHYRPPAREESVLSALVEIVAGYADILRLVQAKNVWEIVPREIEDKGEAVRHQMATIRNSTVPLYIGDDLIDEPAFRALAYGVTIHVGRMRNTKAKYWLPGVPQVHQLISRLATEFA